MKNERKFFPDAETVYHKDYQCDYYRGIVVDGEVRCTPEILLRR
ncbi:hypothetical protein K280104A7_04210 [Candidatus Bariatricus faecipullorum]